MPYVHLAFGIWYLAGLDVYSNQAIQSPRAVGAICLFRFCLHIASTARKRLIILLSINELIASTSYEFIINTHQLIIFKTK